jgi:hypothetical protein
MYERAFTFLGRHWSEEPMDEQQWLASADPQAMLRRLIRGQDVWPINPYDPVHSGRHPLASDRKLRLFACACCRQVWDRLTDPRSRRAVEVAEMYADEGEAVAKAMGKAWLYLDMEAPHEDGWVWAAGSCSDNLPRWLNDPMPARDRLVPPAAQADLLRCLFGNPFRDSQRLRSLHHVEGKTYEFTSPRLRSWLAWNNGTVPRLAEQIYADLDWAALPVLADALEESGCVDADLLGHLRGPGPHAKGCWAIDLLLGKF